MQKIFKTKLMWLLLITPFLLCGCYNKFEIDNLAYVIALGADLGENNNLDITYQIAVPLKIVSESVDNIQDTYTTYTVSAPSLSEANKIVNAMISKELNLSQVKAIFYSKDLATSDLKGHINGLISHTDIRPKSIVAIYDGKVSELLKNISPKLENNVARYYELIFSSHNYSSQVAVSELFDFYTSSIAKDRSPFTILIKSDENSNELLPSRSCNI